MKKKNQERAWEWDSEWMGEGFPLHRENPKRQPEAVSLHEEPLKPGAQHHSKPQQTFMLLCTQAPFLFFGKQKNRISLY